MLKHLKAHEINSPGSIDENGIEAQEKPHENSPSKDTFDFNISEDEGLQKTVSMCIESLESSVEEDISFKIRSRKRLPPKSNRLNIS